MFAWGFNGHFELGLGEGTHRNSPQLVRALEARNVTTLAAGGYHAMAVTGSGGLFTWGACPHPPHPRSPLTLGIDLVSAV